MWLMYGATDDEVDMAGDDRFPNDFNKLIRDLERAAQTPHEHLAALHSQLWKRLCSFTHTGYQQIGPRLTPLGLGLDYSDSEIMEPLVLADALALWTLNAFARISNDATLGKAVQDWVRARTIDAPTG